ncbi:hypothetical protein ACF0H5_012516 [Mactra antiquata]
MECLSTGTLILRVVVILACTHLSLGLFYTTSKENDYPRFGKRHTDLYSVLRNHKSFPEYNINDEMNEIDSSSEYGLVDDSKELFGDSWEVSMSPKFTNNLIKPSKKNLNSRILLKLLDIMDN